MNKTLSIKQLAERMNLGTQAAKKWIKENVDVRYPLNGKRKRFYTPKEVDKILKEFQD